MASPLIEALRGRVPYIRRLHRRIDEVQRRLAAVEAAPDLRPETGSHAPDVAARFRDLLRCVQPHDVAGHRKQRFGADLDGGYVMLDDFGAARTALSLGIGPEVSWDAAVATRGLRVLQFDHTVECSPLQHSNFVFHKNRVVGRRETPDDITLSGILARPELAQDRDIIAKIDIEDHEWELLAQTDPVALSRIRQLAIEFHNLHNFVEPAWRRTALAALEKLAASHACIHIHGNNWGTFTVIGGIPFPDVFEATFVRRGDYALTPSTAVFPTELDRPSNPRVSDLYLGCWNY